MRCDRCSRDAIVFQRYSGLHLCGDHFERDLAARAKRTIRARGWIRTGDRIAVALSGGTGSSSLLHFLSLHFGMRRDLSLVAITVDEGTGPSRDMSRIEQLAEGMGIEWAGTSFTEEFGGTLEAGGEHLAGSCRDLLRGHALTSLGKRIGATKLALGTTLDDEARSVLLKILRGEATRLMLRLRPGGGRIPLIRPFLRIPELDVALYARLNGTGCEQGLCPRTRSPQENEVRRILDEYSLRHPGAMFSLVNLGGALSGMEEPDARVTHPCDGCREPSAAACAARGMLDRVDGHG